MERGGRGDGQKRGRGCRRGEGGSGSRGRRRLLVVYGSLGRLTRPALLAAVLRGSERDVVKEAGRWKLSTSSEVGSRRRVSLTANEAETRRERVTTTRDGATTKNDDLRPSPLSQPQPPELNTNPSILRLCRLQLPRSSLSVPAPHPLLHFLNRDESLFLDRGNRRLATAIELVVFRLDVNGVCGRGVGGRRGREPRRCEAERGGGRPGRRGRRRAPRGVGGREEVAVRG